MEGALKVEGEADEDYAPLDKGSEKSSKRGRKKKYEGRDRNYRCSCGLTYLSYPALYTHVKIKHKGKAPGVIQMPRSEKVTRLKRYNFEEQEGSDAYNGEKYFNSILEFLNKIGTSRMSYTITEAFVTIKCQQGAPLVDAIAECDDEKHNYLVFQSGIYNISIDHSFARFLLKLQNRVDFKIFQQVVVLLLIWRRTINIDYQKFEKQSFNCYSRDASCSNVLQVVNEIIMTQFSEQSSRFRKILEDGVLFHPAKRAFNLLKFIYLFSRWLFASRYTNLKLQFNKAS